MSFGPMSLLVQLGPVATLNQNPIFEIASIDTLFLAAGIIPLFNNKFRNTEGWYKWL
jgi:hypothetical protein